MKTLKRTALLLAVGWSALLVAGCSQDRSAHEQLKGDDRVSLIKIDGECYVLYHAGWGRSITHTKCPSN